MDELNGVISCSIAEKVEEGEVFAFDGGDEDGAVEIAVATFAGGFGGEEAGVAVIDVPSASAELAKNSVERFMGFS